MLLDCLASSIFRKICNPAICVLMINYYNIGNVNNIHMLLYVCRFVKLGDDAVKMSVEQPTMKSTCLYVEISI